MLLGCDPGDIFTVRNVANLVPPADRDQGHHGVLAAIQFAVDQLKVGRIIVLGHAHCGGIRALMERPAGAAGEPDYLNRWMDIAEPARQRVLNQMPDAPDAEPARLRTGVHPDPLRNLESLPSVRRALEAGTLTLHGWYFDLVAGALLAYSQRADGFPPIVCPCSRSLHDPSFRHRRPFRQRQDHPDRSHAAAAAARAGGQRDQAQPPRFRDGAARQGQCALSAGRRVMVASPYRYAIVHELRGGPELTLAQQLERLAPADLVLVEGFKQAAIPRIEVYRPALGKPALHAEDAGFLAVVTDAALEMTPDATLPCLPLNEPDAVAAFICRTLGLAPGKPRFSPGGQDQSVTGRRRTTLAPCRPGKQDIHDPYRFQNRPRRPAVTPASPVHAHHRHLAGRVGGGVVHDQLDAVAVLAAG